MSAITAILKPREKDIGEFSVRRALPYAKHRSIGPWVFFDHFGPVTFEPGEGINVRPHPHINLATVTYLFDGEIFHRDSLGNALPIRPGAINLMIAGKGIVHSERTRPELRASGYNLHGLQLWHALPGEFEETEPAFYHTPSEDIPSVTCDGAQIRVMIGSAYGVSSPVKTYSPNLYFEVDLEDGASIVMPGASELGLYVVKGEADVNGETAPINAMCVLETSESLSVTARGQTRFAVIGGDPLGERHLFCNFVSSRKDRIERAKQDWREGRFPQVPGDADEFIPLPD